jgi:hypothetical protein
VIKNLYRLGTIVCSVKDFENIMYHSLVLQGEIILFVSTLVTVHLANMNARILAFSWQYYFHFASNGREI